MKGNTQFALLDTAFSQVVSKGALTFLVPFDWNPLRWTLWR